VWDALDTTKAGMRHASFRTLSNETLQHRHFHLAFRYRAHQRLELATLPPSLLHCPEPDLTVIFTTIVEQVVLIVLLFTQKKCRTFSTAVLSCRDPMQQRMLRCKAPLRRVVHQEFVYVVTMQCAGSATTYKCTTTVRHLVETLGTTQRGGTASKRQVPAAPQPFGQHEARLGTHTSNGLTHSSWLGCESAFPGRWGQR